MDRSNVSARGVGGSATACAGTVYSLCKLGFGMDIIHCAIIRAPLSLILVIRQSINFIYLPMAEQVLW